MQTSPSLVNLAPALARVHAQIKSFTKDAKNPFFDSKFTSLDSIMQELRPILAGEGFSVIHGVTNPETVEGELACINVSTMLLHASGEWIRVDVCLPVGQAPIEKGKPERAPTAQTAGGAVTYGKRYGVSCALALSSDEDDDGNATSQGRRTASAPRPQGASQSSPPRATGDGTMPFGKTKGTPLAKLPVAEIQSALAWAQEKGKFTEFQRDAQIELDKRGALVSAGGDEPPPHSDDDMPF